jgi:hypothetical protein
MTHLKSVVETALNESSSSDDHEQASAFVRTIADCGESGDGPSLSGPDLSGIVDADADSGSVGDDFRHPSADDEVRWFLRDERIEESSFGFVISQSGGERRSESDSTSDDGGTEPVRGQLITQRKSQNLIERKKSVTGKRLPF